MCGFAVWLTKFSSFFLYRSLVRINNVLVQIMVVIGGILYIRLLEIMSNKTVLIKITALLGKPMECR